MLLKSKDQEDLFATRSHAHEAQREDARTPALAHSAAANTKAPLDAEKSRELFGHFAEAAPHAAATVHAAAAPHAAAAKETPAPSLDAVRSGHAVLKQGMNGPAVVAIQKALHLTADGDFGPGTAAAVKHYQQSHHLTSDGVVGAATLHALEGGGTKPGPAPTHSPGHGELSGGQWVARFPTSSSLDALVGSFQSHTRSFVSALHAAGANVSIAATRRPPERAFLMHYAYEVAHGKVAPESVPAHAGININWVHATRAQSIAAAQQMVAGYDIAFEPALTSKHIAGLAIDMNITWSGTIHVHNASGHAVSVSSPNNGADNATLHDIGRTYGVIKLISDRPHWSDDGH